MAGKSRYCPGGYVYHVLNRSAGRTALFRREEDYAAFVRVMLDAYARVPLRIIGWCLMKNHWHFVVWPRTDDEVTGYFRVLAHTHAMRWRVAHRTVGWGHLYQGRFKAFPVESGSHVLTVCRYVERNALSAGVVRRAEDWRWGSLWLRHQTAQDDAGITADVVGGAGGPLAGPEAVDSISERCADEEGIEPVGGK